MAEELNCGPGCDTTPRDPAVEMTPGQLLHRLHTIDLDEQLDLARRVLESRAQAHRCFVENHADRVAYLEARVGELKNTIGELRAKSENRLEVGDRLGWLLVEAREEIDRLRREVEFEANATDPGREGGYFRDNIRFPLCSCFTAEQISALDTTRWSRPQRAVHPEGGPA